MARVIAVILAVAGLVIGIAGIWYPEIFWRGFWTAMILLIAALFTYAADEASKRK